MTAIAASSGSGTGSMKPEWVRTAIAFGPTGSRVVIGVSALPVYLRARERLTVSARAAMWGSRSGPSMVANVSPGTPATANSPRDSLGVPHGELEHRVHAHRPAHEHRPVDAVVVHHRQRILDELLDPDPAAGRRGGPSRRCRGGSRRRPAPRSRGEERRPGPGAGAEAVAEHDGRAVELAVRVVGPARRRVPSSDRTSSKAIRASPAVRAAEAGMAPIVPEGGPQVGEVWQSPPVKGGFHRWALLSLAVPRATQSRRARDGSGPAAPFSDPSVAS